MQFDSLLLNEDYMPGLTCVLCYLHILYALSMDINSHSVVHA